MSLYRSRNRDIAVKMMASPGVDPVPTTTSNAVKIRSGGGFQADLSNEATDYLQGSLTESAPIPGGGGAKFNLPCFLTGAGAAGTAPDFGKLLRASGLSETLTASAVTGTAQDGAASAITLASGASATNNAYRGMVITTTGGTGSGQTNLISAYNGSTKVATVAVPWATTPDNTTTYSIVANALYRPVTTGLEAVAIYEWLHHPDGSSDSRLAKVIDAMMGFNVGIQPKKLPTIEFQASGRLVAAPADATKPSTAVYDSVGPRPFVNAQAYLGGASVRFSDFSFNIGAAVQSFDDPADAYGQGAADIVSRKAEGRIVANMVLTSSRNAFADWQASTSRDLWLRWGDSAGNRVSLYFPAIRFTGNERQDANGFAAEALPFQAIGSDAELFLCIH